MWHEMWKFFGIFDFFWQKQRRWGQNGTELPNASSLKTNEVVFCLHGTILSSLSRHLWSKCLDNKKLGGGLKDV